MTSSAREPVHLGYTATELATSPYARFYKPEMSALPAHVREAIAGAGLAVCSLEEASTRTESEVPVPGLIAVARKV